MIDVHGHCSDERISSISAPLVEALKSAGLTHMILGGVETKEWERQFDLVDRFPGFFTPVIGIHPWTVRDCSDHELQVMFTAMEQNAHRVTLLGEMGFDFYQSHTVEQIQKQTVWCQKQLDLAERLGKPVVIHVVRGHSEMLTLLRGREQNAGLIHGFQSSKEIASEYVSLGFKLSFGERSFRGKSPSECSWIGTHDFVIESDGPQIKEPHSLCVSEIADQWMKSLTSTAKFLGLVLGMSEKDVWAQSDINAAEFKNKTY